MKFQLIILQTLATNSVIIAENGTIGNSRYYEQYFF